MEKSIDNMPSWISFWKIFPTKAKKLCVVCIYMKLNVINGCREKIYIKPYRFLNIQFLKSRVLLNKKKFLFSLCEILFYIFHNHIKGISKTTLLLNFIRKRNCTLKLSFSYFCIYESLCVYNIEKRQRYGVFFLYCCWYYYFMICITFPLFMYCNNIIIHQT